MYAPKNKNKLCSSSFFTVLTAYKNTSKRLRSFRIKFCFITKLSSTKMSLQEQARQLAIKAIELDRAGILDQACFYYMVYSPNIFK